MPNIRSISWRYSVRPADGLEERPPAGGVLPHRLQLARRAGQHDHGRARARGERDDEPGRCADRLEHHGALGDHRLLAVARADGLLVDVRPALGEPFEDLGDAALERRVEHERPAGEVRDDAGGQVVLGRPEPATGAHDVHAGVGEEPQGVHQVLGAVADDDRVGVVDAEVAQALGQPRAVAVDDPPGEHLGARDDHAGACAHAPHVGRRPAGRSRRPRRVIS
jgi:hypothetical protein